MIYLKVLVIFIIQLQEFKQYLLIMLSRILRTCNLDLNANNITGTGDISTTGDLTLTSTDAGSSAILIIDLVRDSSSPGNLGQIHLKVMMMVVVIHMQKFLVR